MRQSLLITILFLPIFLWARDDSPVKNFIDYHQHGTEYRGDIKCATRYQIDYVLANNIAAPALNQLAQTLIPQDTTRQRSMRSPGGHFRLSWDESGPNAVPSADADQNGIPDFIDSALVIFDRVWEIEINQMGYKPPPGLDGQPVSTYQIYFSNIPYYGITWFDKEIPSLPGENYTSYMEVHNNFNGFYSAGISGLQVTAAHEFHHAIQLGYNVRSEDFFFYEMTSTWIENKLYPAVKDYYQYMPSFFNDVSNTSFNLYNSSTLFPYGNALYLQMLDKLYDQDIVKDIWDKFPVENSGMDAIKRTLQEQNNTWQESLNEYGLWLYYTGDRAVNDQYLPNAAELPQVRVANGDKFNFTGDLTQSLAINSYANRYVEVYDLLNFTLLLFASTNGAPSGGLRWITPFEDSGFLQLNKGFNYERFPFNDVTFVISNATNDRNDYNLTLEQPVTDEIAISQNPIIVRDNNQEVQFKVPSNSEIYIYSLGGYLIARLEKSSSQIRSWNLRNTQGDAVASGIYFWLIKSERGDHLNKFTIIR
jgi:hypothetical protein